MDTGNDGARMMEKNPLLTFRLRLLAEFTTGSILEGVDPDEETWESYLVLFSPNPHKIVRHSIN